MKKVKKGIKKLKKANKNVYKTTIPHYDISLLSSKISYVSNYRVLYWAGCGRIDQ